MIILGEKLLLSDINSLKYLLDCGIDIFSNQNALIWASYNGHFEIVKFLVENGTNANSDWALRWASKNGHINIVRLLIESGADVNSDELTLSDACSNGHYEIVRLLIESGVDVHSCNNNALRSSLRYCNEKHKNFKDRITTSIKILQLLLENGANINYTYVDTDEYEFNTYCSLLGYACVNDSIEIPKFLIQYGADVNAINGDALYQACSFDNIEIFKLLLENGADIHINNDAPLQRAVLCDAFEITKMLLQYGANIHADDDEALINACFFGSMKFVRLLLDNGANIHAQNNKIFDSSCACGHIKYIQHFLEGLINHNDYYEKSSFKQICNSIQKCNNIIHC